MILVLTGTHHQPFDRLVLAAGDLASRGERVVVQAGASALRPARCEVVKWFTPAQLAELADIAEVLVCHGGPGSLFLAWERGRIPVVMPRDPARGEHVDDHQLRFARTLSGRAEVVHEVEALASAVERVRGVLEPVEGARGCARPAFVARFAREIRSLVSSSSRTSPASGAAHDE